MAVNLLDHGSDTTDQASIPTASISPTANSLLVAICSSSQGTAIGTHSVSEGGTLSFTMDTLTTRTWRDQGAGDLRRITIFYADTGATPGTGALTFARGATGQSGWGWRVWEITNPAALTTNGLDAILQNIGDDDDTDVTSLSASFAALASDSVALVYVHVDDEGDAVITVPGYTMDTVSVIATPAWSLRGGVESPATTTAVAPDWGEGAGLNADTAAFVALEIEVTPTGATHEATGTITLTLGLSADATISAPGTPTFTSETEGSDSSSGPWSTGTIDVVDGRGYLLTVANWNFGADPGTPTIDATAVGLTFTQVATRVAETTGDNRIRETLFAAVAEADATGAITINFASANFGGGWSLTRVGEFDPENFPIQSVTDYTDSSVTSFEIGSGTTGTDLAAFADPVRNAVFAAWALRLVLTSPVAADGLRDLHTVQHDEPVGTAGDITLFVAALEGENLTPSASWSGSASAVAGIAVEIGARPAGTIEVTGTLTLTLGLSGNAVIVGAPEDIPGSAVTIRTVRRVLPARVYVHQSNPARIRQVVTAATVNRSYATMKVTQCTFTIPSDEALEPMSPFLDPRTGRLVVVESSAYVDPWVGGIVEWSEDGAGKASILAVSYDAIFSARLLPTSTQVVGNAGSVFRDLITLANQENDTGVVVAENFPAGPPVEHDFGDYYLWDALTEMCRAIRWEWWIEYEVRPESIYAVAHLAPKRGEKRTDIRLVQGDRTIERLGSKINTAGVSHRIRVVGGQERTTQAFADRPRHTAVIADALLSSDELIIHGDRIEHSALSATAFTRRDRVLILDHLRGQAAVDLATDRLLSEPRVAERMLMLRVLSDASNWEHVRPGNSILVELPPPALIHGYSGPVRVLETQPMEENGHLEFVAQVLEEGT